MNINIVYSGHQKDDILARLSNTLANATGWSVDRTPRAGVDLNHFISYLEFAERYSDWHFTPTSTWFTHYDEGRPRKELWWGLAAENVGLRLTSAQMYYDRLAATGPTAMVKPPVDQTYFTIQPTPLHEKPHVGLAGFVHPGGRKGEGMVGRLAGSKLGSRIELIASGEGWPVLTKRYDWGSMPEFYMGLDIFLCTSTIEGIPSPPLEALASGVQVVIPRRVGLLDDLPDVHGIWRYEPGDLGAMVDALRLAIAAIGDVDREALRAAIQPYTAATWAADHEAAFAAFLGTETMATIESDRHGERGVLYVAYGEPARKCAKAAIASFRQYMPGIPVALVGVSSGLGEDVFISYPDTDVGGRSAKVAIYDLAPKGWENILYLDADTEILGDVSFLFDVLDDGWDMVICKNPDKYHVASEMRRSDNGDECDATFAGLGTSELIQLNGGVFAFQRNARTALFFQHWQREWARWGKRDQAALLRALFACPLWLYVLGNNWNWITRYDDGKEGAVIAHYPMTARRWRGKIRARSDSPEAWAAVKEFEAGKR